MLPGFVAALRTVRGLGYEAVIVTNQSGVSRGVMSAEDVCRIHDNLRGLLREQYGQDLLDIRYCPHVDADGCSCRKPLPGMLVDAAAEHGLSLALSWMIGDSERDITAGRSAGCRTVLVTETATKTEADYWIEGMGELDALLARILAVTGE